MFKIKQRYGKHGLVYTLQFLVSCCLDIRSVYISYNDYEIRRGTSWLITVQRFNLIMDEDESKICVSSSDSFLSFIENMFRIHYKIQFRFVYDYILLSHNVHPRTSECSRVVFPCRFTVFRSVADTFYKMHMERTIFLKYLKTQLYTD